MSGCEIKRVLLLTFLGCVAIFSNYSLAENNKLIKITNYGDVAFCQVLGDVTGESRMYWTPNTGLQSARKEAAIKAQQLNATHLVWRAEKTGAPPTIAIGRAYDCNQTQQSNTSPSQDLLNAEYARLLGDATQGKISYVAAFSQLDQLRIKLASNDLYLSQYFIFLGEAARKVDAREMTYEEADKFLDERRNLIAQIALKDTQQKVSSQVVQLLREDQDLKIQLEQITTNDNASNAALMGLGLGLMNIGSGFQQAPRPPSQTVYSIPGSRPITCTTMNNGGYVSCF